VQGALSDLGEGRSVPAAGKRLDRFLELVELVVQRRGGSGCPKGRFLLIAGVAVMVAALDAGAGPEIVTWPMLLAGLGVGSLASQLGSVTV
jgi:hypothetical protein